VFIFCASDWLADRSLQYDFNVVDAVRSHQQRQTLGKCPMSGICLGKLLQGAPETHDVPLAS
jgi:hypothetical protein